MCICVCVFQASAAAESLRVSSPERGVPEELPDGQRQAERKPWQQTVWLQVNTDTIKLTTSQPVTKLTLLPLFSENYIFGKFDAFCRRLEKIADMASTMESLAALQHMKVTWF